MIDKEKIPEQTYKELIYLYGREQADKIVLENNYNFYAISAIIMEEKLVAYLRLKRIKQWIKKTTRLNLIDFIVVLILISIVIYIFWPLISW